MVGKIKVLVTGGAGYVGSVLCRELLNEGYKVVCLDSLERGDGDSILDIITNKDFEFIHGNILDKDIKTILDKVDAVVHLASLVGAPKCKRNPDLSYITNVSGTDNIIRNLNGQRLVFASTGSVYGALSEVCTEDSELNPQSVYGIHKKEAEKLVCKYVNSVSFRFATACGVSPCMRINLLVNNLVYDAVHNGSISLFQADAKRTFVHVRDMARSFIHGLKNDNSEMVFNCGDNSMNASKRDIAELIKKRVNCEVFYGDYMEDPDKRDYEVNYDRINDYGFRCSYDIEQAINELVPAVKLLNVEGRYA